MTVVEAGAHVLSAIDGDMAGGVERELAARGVQLKLGRALKSIDTATDAKRCSCGSCSHLFMWFLFGNVYVAVCSVFI